MNIKLALSSSVFASLVMTGAQAEALNQPITQSIDNQREPLDKTENIEIKGSRKGYYTEITENAEKLVTLPGTLGDPIFAISALPGVIMPVNGNEPAIRGSAPNDNRYYIDGMPAAYIFHQFNTSIFDKNTVQDFQLYSAGFGAEYTDATGGIIDVRLRDPKNQEMKTTVDASLLRAGLFIETGISENSALYVSGRLGLMQFFLPEDDEEDEDGVRIKTPPEDHDYLAKYVWDISANDQLTINLLGAGDYAEAEFSEQSDLAADNPDFAGEAMINDKFDSQGIAYQHTTQSGGVLNLRATHFKQRDHVEWGDDYHEDIDLTNVMFKASFKQVLSEQHTLTVGAELSDNKFKYDVRTVLFTCTEFDVTCQDTRRDVITDSRSLSSKDTTFYVVDYFNPNDNLNIETGLQYTKNDYLCESHINPRMALTWYFVDSIALTGSAGKYNRFPDIGSVLPEIGNPELGSPQAKHYTLGFKGNAFDNWNWSVEGYHKKLSELPLGLGEEEPDGNLLYVNGVEGKASGIDILLNRSLADNWYGWASLSYSKSERTNIRTNQTRDYTLDTPVVFNMVGNYKFSDTWNAGFRFIVKSGEATTKITGIQPNPLDADKYVATYDEPFADRLPVYSRLDIRVERNFKMFNNEAKWYVDVLNVLNRENITERDLDYKRVNQTGQLFLEDETEGGIFPSVGITFSF